MASNELMLANDQGLPVFKGVSFEEHVETWRTVDESMQNHLWFLGAIAASLVKRYGEDSTGRFASEVGRSGRTVQRFAKTYREWEQKPSALTVLSFQHHAIAARDANPEEVIAMAHDNQWSTRELEEVVKQRRGGAAKYGKRKEEEQEGETDAVMICPHCNGNGVVPYAKANAKARKGK